jgi:MtN3 and saliva related transmembrane protein
LWLTYGFLINDLPIILANVVTLILASTLLFFKIRWKH